MISLMRVSTVWLTAGPVANPEQQDRPTFEFSASP
jgi:hypothetical protein